MQEKLYHIKTFGCQMNIRDSEIMAQKLGEQGYLECADINEAGLIILNTCSVRGKAEQKVFSLLGSLRKNKLHNPDLKICVAGCVAQQEGRKIIERMEHVDLVIGTQHIYHIAHLLEKSARDNTAINLADDYEIPQYVPKTVHPGPDTGTDISSDQFKFSRFVTIMQGCNNFCTYCVVPYTRGREVSRKAADIIAEVTLLVNSGVSEITLLGQNVNSYGTTNKVTDSALFYSFADLLHEVATIAGLRRLRFTTSNPKDLSADLIDCFATIDILCPQFHLPVQSGSDAVLKRMNRNYTISTYLDRVERLIAVRPDIAITTDIIVGFPGETEADFRQTMELLETVKYHGSFSFKYSDRPGTRAAKLDGKIEEKEKSRRLQIFQKRQDEISLERNQAYVGTIKTILVEKHVSAKLMGRTSTNHIVHVETAAGESSPRPGEYAEVKITFGGQHSLKGQLLNGSAGRR